MRFFIIALIIGSLVSCSVKPKLFKKELVLAHHWDSGMIGNNMPGLSGVYKDMIYIWGETADTFSMRFFKADGMLTKTLTFKKGKGPGQILFAFSGGIYDDTIYILDQGMKRISYYDLNGSYIDEVQLNDATSSDLSSFIVIGDKIYIHGSYMTLLAILDRADGHLIKKIDFPEKVDFEQKEIPIQGGTFSYDPQQKMLLIGYYNKPFRLERYDLDLKKIDTVTITENDSYEPCRWQKIPQGGMAIVGHYMIPSIDLGSDYIYIPSPHGVKWGEHGHEPIPSKNFINVFNRKTYKPTGSLIDPIFETVPGGYHILGVIDGMVVTSLWDATPLEKVVGKKIEQTGMYILVLKVK